MWIDTIVSSFVSFLESFRFTCLSFVVNILWVEVVEFIKLFVGITEPINFERIFYNFRFELEFAIFNTELRLPYLDP